MVKETQISIPDEYILSQNYPDPSNPKTSIQFAVGSGQLEVHVTLKIFNLLGQEVAILVDDVKESGYYSATWDASNMPSGVYSCQLKSATFSQTNGMLLLK